MAEASALDPVWGIGLRADDPRAKGPRQWKGKILLSEAISAVREEIRDTETGLANPASVGRFRTPTGNAGVHELSSIINTSYQKLPFSSGDSAPQSCSMTAASACQGPP